MAHIRTVRVGSASPETDPPGRPAKSRTTTSAPEGGATAAAVPILMEKGLINSEDEVVLFNTGSGLKYVGMTPID